MKSSDHVLKARRLIELHFKIGSTYWRMGRTDEAERFFDLALKAFDRRRADGKDDPSTKYYIAALHALRGDVDLALRYFEETLAHLPALNRTRARVDPRFRWATRQPQVCGVAGDTRRQWSVIS